MLSTAQILFALARLGELSYREHIQLDVFMVGGGAIAIGMEELTDKAMLDELISDILQGNDLVARELAAKLLQQADSLDTLSPPNGDTLLVKALGCALAEWFALQRCENAPSWATQSDIALQAPYFLLGNEAEPKRYPRFYARCLRNTPAPFKRRNIIAPPEYLLMV